MFIAPCRHSANFVTIENSIDLLTMKNHDCQWFCFCWNCSDFYLSIPNSRFKFNCSAFCFFLTVIYCTIKCRRYNDYGMLNGAEIWKVF